jgi:hypothetical protein
MPAKWTHTVKAQWHPNPGLFKQSAKVIAKTVADSSRDLKQAMNRVQYYETRAGANLTPANRKNIEAAKKELRRYFGANLAASPQRRANVPSAKPKARKVARTARANASIRPSKKTSMHELPAPKPGAAYWFAWSTEPQHWRKGRSPYRYRVSSMHRFLGRRAMPKLGEGAFYLYAVTIRGKTAHLAQKAIPLHAHAYR